VTDFGEADRVVTLMTEAHGRVAALARGARRPTGQRRFGAALGLFGLGQATLKMRTTSELWVLEEFAAERGFSGIGLDVLKVGHAGYVCEVLSGLAPPHQVEPALFDLGLEVLRLLDAEPPSAERLRVFELGALEAVGLRPVVELCVACEGADFEVQRDVGIDLVRGGIVCARCLDEGIPARALPAAVRLALVALQRSSLADAPALHLAPRLNAACRQLLEQLLEGHLGHPLKSMQFLKKLAEASE
jgi:DNA repair protein RecO (recombination protein O)